MKIRWMIFLRRVGGTVFFILGLIGALLPIVPGWLLTGVGLYLLALDSPGMQHRIRVLRRRYRRVDLVLSQAEKRFGAHIPGSHDGDDGAFDTKV
jgi:hypothetical protein